MQKLQLIYDRVAARFQSSGYKNSFFKLNHLLRPDQKGVGVRHTTAQPVIYKNIYKRYLYLFRILPLQTTSLKSGKTESEAQAVLEHGGDQISSHFYFSKQSYRERYQKLMRATQLFYGKPDPGFGGRPKQKRSEQPLRVPADFKFPIAQSEGPGANRLTDTAPVAGANLKMQLASLKHMRQTGAAGSSEQSRISALVPLSYRYFQSQQASPATGQAQETPGLERGDRASAKDTASEAPLKANSNEEKTLDAKIADLLQETTEKRSMWAEAPTGFWKTNTLAQDRIVSVLYHTPERFAGAVTHGDQLFGKAISRLEKVAAREESPRGKEVYANEGPELTHKIAGSESGEQASKAVQATKEGVKKSKSGKTGAKKTARTKGKSQNLDHKIEQKLEKEKTKKAIDKISDIPLQNIKITDRIGNRIQIAIARQNEGGFLTYGRSIPLDTLRAPSASAANVIRAMSTNDISDSGDSNRTIDVESQETMISGAEGDRVISKNVNQKVKMLFLRYAGQGENERLAHSTEDYRNEYQTLAQKRLFQRKAAQLPGEKNRDMARNLFAEFSRKYEPRLKQEKQEPPSPEVSNRPTGNEEILSVQDLSSIDIRDLASLYNRSTTTMMPGETVQNRSEAANQRMAQMAKTAPLAHRQTPVENRVKSSEWWQDENTYVPETPVIDESHSHEHRVAKEKETKVMLEKNMEWITQKVYHRIERMIAIEMERRS